MDKVTVFADRLLLPRMILPLDERFLIQETDDMSLWSYRDTDGEGVADEKFLAHQGDKALASVGHQDSGLTWAMDNRVAAQTCELRSQAQTDLLRSFALTSKQRTQQVSNNDRPASFRRRLHAGFCLARFHRRLS